MTNDLTRKLLIAVAAMGALSLAACNKDKPAETPPVADSAATPAPDAAAAAATAATDASAATPAAEGSAPAATPAAAPAAAPAMPEKK